MTGVRTRPTANVAAKHDRHYASKTGLLPDKEVCSFVGIVYIVSRDKFKL